jgi:hypothetical protein
MMLTDRRWNQAAYEQHPTSRVRMIASQDIKNIDGPIGPWANQKWKPSALSFLKSPDYRGDQGF